MACAHPQSPHITNLLTILPGFRLILFLTDPSGPKGSSTITEDHQIHPTNCEYFQSGRVNGDAPGSSLSYCLAYVIFHSFLLHIIHHGAFFDLFHLPSSVEILLKRGKGANL